jgi:hypothetical protein
MFKLMKKGRWNLLYPDAGCYAETLCRKFSPLQRAGGIQIDDGPVALLKRGFPEESIYTVKRVCVTLR